MRRGSASEDQMGHMRSILDGVVLGKEPTKTSSTDNDLILGTSEVPAQAFDVVDNLLESVWFRARALAVTPEIEGQDSELIPKLAVHGEVRPVISFWDSSTTILGYHSDVWFTHPYRAPRGG